MTKRKDERQLCLMLVVPEKDNRELDVLRPKVEQTVVSLCSLRFERSRKALVDQLLSSGLMELNA